jgi:hypothetical protein
MLTPRELEDNPTALGTSTEARPNQVVVLSAVAKFATYFRKVKVPRSEADALTMVKTALPTVCQFTTF